MRASRRRVTTGTQERQRVAACQAGHLHGPQVIERPDRTVGPLSHDHPDAVGVQSPCDEGQHVDRLLVEPLQVVDHDQDRTGPGDRAQQRVHPEADQDLSGGGPNSTPIVTRSAWRCGAGSSSTKTLWRNISR
jgi:hypothetical protein